MCFPMHYWGEINIYDTVVAQFSLLLLEEIMQRIQYDPHTAKKVSLSNSPLSPSATLHARANTKKANTNTHITRVLRRLAAAVLCFFFRPTGGFEIVKLKSVWYEEWPECVEGKRSDSPGAQLVLSSPLLEFRQVPWCWEINEAALALWSLQDTHTHTQSKAFVHTHDSFRIMTAFTYLHWCKLQTIQAFITLRVVQTLCTN